MELRDQRLMVEMLTVTEIEAVQAEEDESFEMLQCLELGERRVISGKAAREDLINVEEERRFYFKKEEECARNQLEIKFRLALHGAAELENFVPQTVTEDTSTNEAWRNLPTIFEPSEENLTVPSVSDLASELREVGGEDAAFFLTSLALESLFRKEKWKRADIVNDEARQRSRLNERFIVFFQSLAKMEIELKNEKEEMIMSPMSDEERIIYKTSPAAKEEQVQRNMLLVCEEQERNFQRFNLAEGVSREILAERFLAARNEIRLKIQKRIVFAISQRAFNLHGGMRFKLWEMNAHWQHRMRLARKAVLEMEKKAVQSLIRRYCATWNRAPEQKRFRQQRELLADWQMAEYIEMEIEEQEARGRSTIFVEEEISVASWEKAFQSEGGARKKHFHARITKELEEKTRRKHMMRRLVTWYKFWKGFSMIRKTQWLFQNVVRTSTANCFSRWLKFRNTRHGHRLARWDYFSKVKYEKQREALSFEEATGRNALESIEKLNIILIKEQQSHNYVTSRERMILRCLSVIAEDNQSVQQVQRFQIWRSWLQIRQLSKKAVALLQETEKLFLGRMMKKWIDRHYDRHRAKQSFVDAVIAEKEILNVQCEEEFDRIMLAQRENWSRTRRDFRMSNVLGNKTRHQVALSFASCGDKAVIEYRFWMWTRYLRRRKHLVQCALVVDHMEYENELALIQRYVNYWTDVLRQNQKTRHAQKVWDIFLSNAESLDKEEAALRNERVEEEQWRFTRIQLAHSRAIGALCRQQQQAVVEIMATFCTQAVRQVYMRKLRKFVLRRRWVRSASVWAEEMSQESSHRTMKQYVVKWRRFWWEAIRPRLAFQMEKKNSTLLIRRYWRLLAPASIRMARISRAKANLNRAQVAARLLDTDMSPRHKSPSIIKSHNPFLPPLVRGAEKSKKAAERK